MDISQALKDADQHIEYCKSAGMNPYDAIMAVCDTFPCEWHLARLATALAAISGEKLDVESARNVEINRRANHAKFRVINNGKA